MTNEYQVGNMFSKGTLDDIEKLELQNCYGAVRLFLQRRMQLVVFFGAANITLLGLAVQYRGGLLLIVAGAVLLLFIVVDFHVLTNLIPYLYSGLRLEWKAGRELGLLNCEVLSHSKGLDFREKLRVLMLADDAEELVRGFRDSIPHAFAFRGKSARLVFFVALTQILAGLLAPLLLGWSWTVHAAT